MRRYEFSLENPIPQQLRDPERFREFYEGYMVVPYAGNTKYSSHRFLKMLYDFYELSPSQGSCIDDILAWAFEGDLGVYINPRSGLRLSEVRMADDNDAIEFADFIESFGIDLPKIIEVNKELARNYKVAGTAYMHYVEVEVNGQWYVDIGSIHPMMAMFLNTRPDEEQYLVVSDVFFTETSFTSNPRTIGVYPNFTEHNGVRETVFVWKNQRDYGKFYGRPNSIQSFYAQFVEWSTLVLSGKIANSDNGSLALVTVEKPDENSFSQGRNNNMAQEVKDLGDGLRKRMTNRGGFGDMQAINIIDYPRGGQAPNLLKLDINRDHEWARMSFDVASAYIYQSHRWSAIINGQETAKAGVGGNVLIDTLKTKNTGTIKPFQQESSRFWKSTLVKRLIMLSGKDEYSIFNFGFQDNLQSLIESLKDGSNGNQNDIDAGGGNTGIEGSPGGLAEV